MKTWLKKKHLIALAIIVAVLLVGKTFFSYPLVPYLIWLQTKNISQSLFGWWPSSWEEEVLLHDGRKIIVKRSQTTGGRHQIGQSPPAKEHTITFNMPGSGKKIQWKNEYAEELGRANFNEIALHILGDTPYMVVEPNLCLSYNKWGRPNPPYVIFKHDGDAWKRIELSELPVEFSDINLVIDKSDKKKFSMFTTVSVETVKKLNGGLKRPEYKTIIRTPIQIWCEEMIQYKCNGVHMGWGAPGEFNRESYERLCKSKMVGR